MLMINDQEGRSSTKELMSDEDTLCMWLINIVSLSLDKYLYLLCQQQR